MGIIAADFETHYDSEYSLSKLTTEQYLRDPRFEAIMVSLSINGGPAVAYVGAQIEPALRAIDWETNSLLAFNTAFDGAILGWKYGIYPKFYLDAMGMARARGRTYRGASLAKILELERMPPKGDYVVAAKGKRLADFNPYELQHYANYCCGDTNSTVALYRRYIENYPLAALRIQDQVLRMFIEPRLMLNRAKLVEYQQQLEQKKWQTLAEVAHMLGMTWDGAPIPENYQAFRAFDILAEGQVTSSMSKLLRSDAKLAELLGTLNVDPPTKLSPTTGKITYAFAKTDQGFIDLLDHDDQEVQTLVAARIGVKTTIEESRTGRLIGIAERGTWPVAYTYYAAHTGRLGGADKVNPQNFKRGGTLRDSIKAPPGHVLVAADESQIECRIVNQLAGQHDVIEAFRAYDAGTGPDVYCIFASKVYNRLITPTDKQERIVGKHGELSLGFGAGSHSFRQMLFAQAGMRIKLDEAQTVVDIYRTSHDKVKRLWSDGNDALKAMCFGRSFQLGLWGILDGSKPKEGIGLPNGLFLRYPLLAQIKNTEGETQYHYVHRANTATIHGSKLVENVVQALAAIVMYDAWLRIVDQGYRIVLSTHDELVACVPRADADECAAVMRWAMTQPVAWAPDMPIACTVGIGETYGECK